MEYYAHIEGTRTQTIKEHLEGTARLAGEFAGAFGKSDWGYCCGLLHDVGKYSKAFQRRLHGEDIRVDHSTAGVQLCMEKGGLYEIMSYCIAGHHAGLPDQGGSSDTGDMPTLMGRRRKKIEDYQAYKEDIQIPELRSLPFESAKAKNKDFSLSVFIRMLYSCLVDADFLDTEQFMTAGQTAREGGEEMEILLAKLEAYTAGWREVKEPDTVNGRRTEILNHCLTCGEMGKGIFRLTVPTGGGKTVASLAFALRHAVKQGMKRIIYVIPYTSIIEQNAGVFREILGDENVLENHSNIDYEGKEELKPFQLAAENWDKPVVVTTNVQFFESLFSNKSSRCRKLHNIVNSVIIFDEAQILPFDFLKPCTAMMEELVERYGSSIVLCTATQPALTSFFREDAAFTELCPRVEEQFRFFERVTYNNLDTLTEENLAERLKGEFQTLCIVNTKKRAQALYEAVKGEGVYHLSAAMYPKHRKRVLETIRKRLYEGKRCVLISTSLVEAGVDLDFETVYRQLAGVDSIIQAAGRCNREGKRSPEDSKVFVFRFEGWETVPGQRQQIDVAKPMFDKYEDIASLECIEEYFEALYHLKGEGLDKKKIMEEFKAGGYHFAKAAKAFKLIEGDTKTIYIPANEEAVSLLRRMKEEKCTRSEMRRAGQYCVQVYEREFKKLYGMGMVRAVSENIEDSYELTKKEQYTEELGLKLEVEEGVAQFL